MMTMTDREFFRQLILRLMQDPLNSTIGYLENADNLTKKAEAIYDKVKEIEKKKKMDIVTISGKELVEMAKSSSSRFPDGAIYYDN